MRTTRWLLALSTASILGCGDDEGVAPKKVTSLPSVDVFMSTLPQSCAFSCSAECTEPATPYTCTAAAPWSAIPHAPECEPFDGTFPPPAQGKCTASEPTGEAAAKAGPIPGGWVLPDGHRILPAGRHVTLEDDGLEGGFPMNLLSVPGSRLALLTDGGIRDNSLRVLDLDALAANGPPVASLVSFAPPQALFYGLAFVGPNRAFASGGGDGIVYAFDLDLATGALTPVQSADLVLGSAGGDPWYAGAIAVTGDATRMLVAPSEHVTEIAVLSLQAADYGAKLASIDVDSYALFDLRLDPFDPMGKTFYATDQGENRLLEIDGVAATITRTFPLEKNPAQLVFLDARYLVVAESNGDSLAIVDRVVGDVATRIPVFEPGSPRGFSPNALAFDVMTRALYAALAGVNAVEVYDVSMDLPPAITPRGRIPTAWWPTSVLVDADGSLVVATGKGEGAGTDGEQYEWTKGPITDRMRGSVQRVPAPDLADLSEESAVVDASRNLATIAGRPEVTCPDGADDFPIPVDPSTGPSKQIKHVIFVVRENKTYDAVFGDLPDVGDGDPDLIMASDPELQGRIWQNARAIAKAFTNFDNFYTSAEQSIQGHIWTAYGRTTDYIERTWLTTWGRGTRPPTSPSISDESHPEEGGIFKWLDREGIAYDNMGEIVSESPLGLDSSYPGLAYTQDLPDVDKSCYIAGRIRVTCDLKPFSYVVQPNDHTAGGSAGSPAPEVMIAVNDEATGLLLDALSHSPRWKDTLLIVTEDDPQDGGDHVDLHRTILLMASPWVRRGYVSKGHYDMASIHKLVAHIFGLPYNNESVRSAMLPLDAFTSTPDYTPYDVLHRTVDAPCNAAETKEAKEAEGWDFSDPDEQPGLSEQIERMMKRPRAERGIRVIHPRR